MIIEKISLLNFRNLVPTELLLKDGTNIFYGDNAQGKTNLLESIYLCTMGKSFRTRLDSQLISFSEKEAHVRVFIEKKGRNDRIDVHIKKDEKKGIAINGLPIKKYGELFGTLRSVLFSPEDLQLIKNGPGDRRRFLDMEICQLSPVYFYELKQYQKVLKQRNKLLKKMSDKKRMKDVLFPWDCQLIDYGEKIIEKRKNYIEKINQIALAKHSSLTGGKETLSIFYRPNCLSEALQERLDAHLEKDILFGSTSVGPHKDDIQFYINGNDVKTYGSQGQQRSAVLSLKLAELELIFEETGDWPVLLLDDVLSELDERRQQFLMQDVEDIQMIITCTGIEDALKQRMDLSSVFYIKEGSALKVEY